jgi:hypothetical protein
MSETTTTIKMKAMVVMEAAEARRQRRC